jgi:1,4-dihydroxy-2-naphthoyl-CoA hydrolase
MFEYRTTIKIHEADGAGILFFANYFKLAHDAYEAFMESGGLGLGKVLRDESFLLLIVHAAMDYKFSLQTGDNALVKLKVKKVGNTSFILGYEIYRNNKDSEPELASSGETVHVNIDTGTGEKIPLSREVRKILESIK